MTFKSGEIFAGHYRLIKRLGAGSFGEVWLAKNLMAEINVAIKFYSGLDSNGVNDFKEEFKLAYRLRHPNLLHLNHFDVYEQCPYLVMPYCSKGSSSLLRGNVSETRVWEFIRDVSAGLAYLHAQTPPIIHQDIKPGNILEDENDCFIITDFGISKKIEFHMQTLRCAKMGSSGTIAYMSPERLKTPPVVVMASDIWSLGMSVYELVTGQVLWELGGLMQLGGAEVPSLGSNYSVQLSRFVQHCLAINPWERPKAQDAYMEARNVLSGVSTINDQSLSSNFDKGMTFSSRNSSMIYQDEKRKIYSKSLFWCKYGDVFKWGGGAIMLFILAFSFFSLIFPKSKNTKNFSSAQIDTMAVVPIDTPAVIPIADPTPMVTPIKSKPSPKPVPIPVPKPVVVDKDEELWEKCRIEDKVFVYNRYLNEFPKGKHVIEAKKRIRELERMVSREVVY